MVSKGNVLVVDDEINLCRIICAMLAKLGFSATAVHDGVQAIEKVRESDYDVVLLDLILPKMDGLAVLAEIRKIRGSLPVIVMTACGSAEAAEQAKSYGVSAYVNKPFDLGPLVQLVLKVIADNSHAQTAGADRRVSDSSILFSKDQPITIEILNGYPGRTYASSICGKDDRTLTVLAPKGDQGPIEVPPKARVKIGLVAKDAYYSFSTEVLKSRQNPQEVLVLDKPCFIYRRHLEHARLAVRIPISYALGGQDAAPESLDFHSGETRDLSLGGACILVGERIDPGAVLTIELRPKIETHRIGAVARVLRSTHVDQPGDDGWLLGCQFILADPSLHSLLEA